MKISDLDKYTVVGSSGSTIPAAKEKPKKDLLQKTGDVVNAIFPGKQVGESIGTLAGLGIEKAKGLLGGKDNSQFYDTSAPTPLQTTADVASGALNVAGFKGVGSAGSFAKQVLSMAGIGAGISGADTIRKGGNAKETVKNAAIGGAIGASLPVVGAGLNALGRQIETLPSRFVNSALSRSKADVLKDISKDKVDDFANYVLKTKPIGTANKLASESMDNIGTLNNKINSALGSAVRKGGAPVTIGRDAFLDEITKLPEAQGAMLKRADVKSIIERLAPQTKQLLSKPSLTIEESNRLRQLADKTLGDRAFLGGQLSSDKIILKKFADSLRETIKTKAPEGTRQLFAELTNEIRFRDGLLNRIAQKQGNQVLSFGDFIGGGLGGVFGGGLPGAVAGVGARRVIESVPFKLGAAKFTRALTKLEPTISQLAPAQQTAILDFFSEIFSEQNRSKDQSK